MLDDYKYSFSRRKNFSVKLHEMSYLTSEEAIYPLMLITKNILFWKNQQFFNIITCIRDIKQGLDW
jgi:beta-lactamase regulating signal transducer with metallopeptidase domain